MGLGDIAKKMTNNSNIFVVEESVVYLRSDTRHNEVYMMNSD